jgi:hypothetical protein
VEGCAIDDGNSNRDLKPKKISRQGNVRLPISEVIFQLNSARLANVDAREFPSRGI